MPVVLISGCTESGIGHSLALAFHKQGCTVYATARREAAVVGAVPPGLHVLRMDVCEPASIASAVEQVMQEQGRIDILINNAGIGCVGPLVEVDLHTAKQVYDVNVFGMLALTQAVVPHMVAKRQGKIINIGSITGLVPTPFAGIYCSSKAAVHSLSTSLRLELAPFNIQVMLVAPGAIRSNIGKNTAERLAPSLPHLKIYAEYAQVLADRAFSSQTPRSTPTEVFADKVATEALRPRVCRQLYFGHMSGFFTLLSWLPGFIVDFLMARAFSLHKAAKADGLKTE